jgi:hypothetical protein
MMTLFENEASFLYFCFGCVEGHEYRDLLINDEIYMIYF